MLSTSASSSTGRFADKIQMQHRLFAELSLMFGREVPLYDKSLLVNKECNKAVISLLSHKYKGFDLTEEQLDKTSGERHGAIRIGTSDEYKWVTGYFAAFALEPHNFYDMTSLGSKSQPIIATAFRSRLNPEHRVFCSLLMVDSFDPDTRNRIEALLSQREVFSDKAKELILKNDEQGGLEEAEAGDLIREGTERIFKWTGKARDFKLYNELCDTGFKIAADIACFQSHHLNHLTPNTFCMDLYTSAMKFCLGELDPEEFRVRAANALISLLQSADKYFMKLHFRHLSLEIIDGFHPGEVDADTVGRQVDQLASRLTREDLKLSSLNHSGFKDFTEGPAADTPVLLRQDSYKALTEPVIFYEKDGSAIEAKHTARFGEIEQRFYATTPAGRELYDGCLAKAEEDRQMHPGLVQQDYNAYQGLYTEAFAPIPKTLPELLREGLVYGKYSLTVKGKSARGSVSNADLQSLIDEGLVQYEGVRYEDFLPFSAAGIFASNLGQYGTQTTADEKPVYTQETLEKIMGRSIVNPDVTYKGLQAESLLQVYSELGLLDKLPPATKQDLEISYSQYQSSIAPLP